MQATLPLRTIPGANECSSPASTEVDAAERHRTWMSKVDQSRFRLKLMETGKMAAPETPSADFTYIKNAIMHAIKPYDNLEEIEHKDKFVAMSYNMASSQPRVVDYPHSLAHPLSKRIPVLTCISPTIISSPETGSHAQASPRCYELPVSTPTLSG
ncbi:MAG: hypothetical protein L6R38_009620 [Xanthoria sp. 2 TBL-2021]|nr:MAG: hypothetical protein L6R38_009620 [Xanthoria sp. 2 TBL-2021]